MYKKKKEASRIMEHEIVLKKGGKKKTTEIKKIKNSVTTQYISRFNVYSTKKKKKAF